MKTLREWVMRLWGTLRRSARDREIEEELRAHLELAAEQMESRGATPANSQDAARRAARLRYGGVAQAAESMRDQRGLPWLADLASDLRYAFRMLRRSPGFASLAVVIMALGIGANTAVFSVVNTVLLRPLAYRDPDRIVTLASPLIGGEAPVGLPKLVSIPNFQDWHDQSSSFEAMAFYQTYEAPVMSGPAAEYARVARVSPEFFRVFAVQPMLGRFFSAEEAKPGGSGALLISYAYWQSHFGGDADALGRITRVYGASMAVVGVLPPGFQFPAGTDLWYPTDTVFREVTATFRGAQNYQAVGRLKPGVSVGGAQIEMSGIAARLAQQYPQTNKNRTAVVTQIRDELVGDFRVTLYLLLGAVSAVLLIACANTATLLLGKATARTREVSVRIALGASRLRIVRQLTTESLLLALLAGAVGLALAYEGSKGLVALAPASLPQLVDAGIDRWVLIYTFVVSAVTSLMFGLAPSLYASRVKPNDALKQAAARSIIGGGMAHVRSVLATAEIALAVVLLSAAGLLIKSFVALENVALGFRPEKVLVMRATVPAPRAIASLFFKDVLDQVVTLPGVVAAGATMVPPGHVGSMGPYYFDHLPPRRDPSDPNAVISIVSPGVFAALGIPLISGRDFTENDASDQPLVAIVNEAMVRKSLPGGNPIGRQVFCLFDSSQAMTVIGVAGDVRERGPAREAIPECYISYRQHAYNGNTLSFVVRSAGNPAALEEPLRRIAHNRAPDVPVRFTTLQSDVHEGVATPRFRTFLFALFAALAICLATAGVYGVMAYAVGQRTSEIGIRMALGASSGSVLRLMLKQGLVLASIGLALGLAAAAGVTRLLTSMLFQVKPNDPSIYLGVAVLVGTVALAACYLPARRAAAVDPAETLRAE